MSLAAHLPALQVVVPLLAAPLTVLVRRRDLAYAVALAASWAALAIAVALWLQVNERGTISYAIGNWPPPWGIEYRVDRLSALLLTLVAGIAAVVLPYSRASIEAEVPLRQHYLFYTMFVLCLAGLLGIAITGDAFNIFVFLEISSLSTYVLIALGRHRRALVASYQYLVLGTIGATFIVIGVGMLYLMTGTLNIADMGRRIAAVNGSRPVLTALAFLTVGISLKLALFPLHQWLPNAYAYAPSAVSAFLAATATKVAVYVLLRFYFSVFGNAQVFERLPMQEAMLLLALAGMFVASTIAIFQADLKRLFAYSSIGQIGYIILGLSFGSVTGLTATIVHLVNHGVTKGAIFLLLGCVAMVMGSTRLERVQGLGKRMPLTSLGIVICGLSLIGVPGTAGFVSKWYLLLAAIERGQWWLVFLIVISSLLAAAYVWRFVEAAYFREPPADAGDAGSASAAKLPWSMAVPAALLVAATLYFGIDTSFTVGSAAQAAAELMPKALMLVPAQATEWAIVAAMAVPLAGALLIALAGRWPNLREAITLATAALLLACVLSLLPRVLGGDRPALTLITMLPGLDIAFKVEPLGMLFALIASGLWIVNSLYSIGYMRGNGEAHQTRFYVCFALALAATMGIALAGNLFTLFVFYELLTLVTYPLVTHHGTDQARSGGRVYIALLLGTSTVLLLPALVFIWWLTGTTDFTPGGILGGKLGHAGMAGLLALCMFGIGKAALMPFHRWLPAAMVAPTPVSALLHAVAVVKAGVFSVVKLIVYIFGVDKLAASGLGGAADWLVVVAGFTIVAASVVALGADNLKRRLAYSTISQLSYVVMAAALLAPLSLIGAVMHIAAHAVGKITLFFAAGAIYTAAHKTEVSELDGIGRRMPWTLGAFTIAAFSMIGLPPAVGFISKWYMLSGAMAGGHWLAVTVIAASTLLNAGYFLPIVYRAFFVAPAADPHGHLHGEAPLTMVVALTATAAATVLLFFLPDVPLALARLVAGA